MLLVTLLDPAGVGGCNCLPHPKNNPILKNGQKRHRFVARCQFYQLVAICQQVATNLSILLWQTCFWQTCLNLLKQLADSLDKKFWQSTWNKSVDNLQQTCCQQALASHANASWCWLVDNKSVARCQQTFYSLRVFGCANSIFPSPLPRRSIVFIEIGGN